MTEMFQQLATGTRVSQRPRPETYHAISLYNRGI
jgi:hypothetical protein